MAARSPRSEAVVADLMRHAIDLIDAGGIESVTVRALARMSNYSPSTIGYHTAPFEQFLDRVWRKVGIDLATTVLSDPEGDDWPPPAARRLLEWIDEHPLLGSFFVGYGAKPPEAYGVTEWSFLDGMSEALPTDRTLAVLSYLARRFQLALDHAVRWPSDRAGKVGVLAGELRLLDAHWRGFVEPPPPITAEPQER